MGRINESHVKIVWQFLPYTYPTKSELVFARKKYNLRAKAPYMAVYAAACAFFCQKKLLLKITVKYLRCDGFTMILRLC